MVDDDPEEALVAFRAIVDQEDEKGDWCVLPPSCPTISRSPSPHSQTGR